MQLKKNKMLSLSLLLMIAVMFLIFFLDSKDNRASVDKSIFQIPNLDQVDRVVLQSHAGKVDLTFNGTRWLVNGSPADKSAITILFATLKQVEAKRKITSHHGDSLQQLIQKEGVKISCFATGKTVKEFWSLGNSDKNETYFELESGAPHLVVIPGYRFFLASVFNWRESDWRDKQVFSFNWQNIKNMEVAFHAQPEKSFTASFKNNLFGIDGIRTDTTKLDAFMNALFVLRAEKILTSMGDSLTAYIPLSTIHIHDLGGNDYSLQLFVSKSGSKKTIGKTNSDWVDLSPRAVAELIKPKSYFKIN